MGQILMPCCVYGSGELDSITATSDDIKKGKFTVDQDGELIEGNLTDYGRWVHTGLKAGEGVLIPYGIHGGEGYVQAASLSSQTQGTAVAANILKNKTAVVNGVTVTGTMTNVASVDPAKSVVLYNNNLYARMTNGAHVTNTTSGYPEVSMTQAAVASALGIKAEKILSGTTICGVKGTLTCNSILNFSAEIYNRRQVLLKWQNPKVSSGKPFEGVFINYATSAKPGTGGTRIYSGTGDNKTAEAWSKVTVTMPSYSTTYYFSATSYVNFYVNGIANTALYGTTFHSGAVKTSSAPCGDCSDCGDGCSWDCSDCNSPTVCAGGV